MQGYARLNRASITNTTVQDCHCVESVFATAKFESSPLSSWLQSADSLLSSLSLLVFLSCDRHPERFEAAVSFPLFSTARRALQSLDIWQHKIMLRKFAQCIQIHVFRLFRASLSNDGHDSWRVSSWTMHLNSMRAMWVCQAAI